MKKNPLVSIIVISFNHEKYIKECLLSVFNQSYKNVEIIVLDNGSKDNSPQIISQFKKEYSFQFINEKTNLGLTKALNKAIRISSGEYISSISSDDYWVHDKIERQVNILIKNPEITSCSGASLRVNKNSEILPPDKQIKQFTKYYEFKDIFLGNYIYPALNAMTRKNIIEEVNYYDENIQIEDFYMWLKITSKGYKIYTINKLLGFYRIHDSNSLKNNNWHILQREKILLLYKNHKLFFKAIKNHYKMFLYDYCIYEKYLAIKIIFKYFLFSKKFPIGIYKIIFKKK